MRRLDPLTPDEARELDALERALSGLPVDPDLHEFEALVADLRATAPEMSPAFAARLEHAVAEGFPEPAERPPLRLRSRRRWALLPAAGVLAAALIALVVVLGNHGDQGDGSTADQTVAQSSAPAGPSAAESAPAAPGAAVANDSAGAVSAQRKSAPALAAPSPTTAPAPATAAVAPATGPRKVQRSATLALETPSDKFDATTDDVVQTVDQFSGIVASSAIGNDDEA